MKIIEKDFNIQTGKETIIEREETEQEIAWREKAEAEAAKQKVLQAEAEAKKTAAEAKLAALGLTADDLRALGL